MTSRPTIRAVAFDLDGLMFNTEELYVQVADQMLTARGHQLEMDLIHAMMGRPARDAFPIMIDHYGLVDTVEQLEIETRSVFESILPVSLAPMPGLLELLQLLDTLEIPKGIATSSARPYLTKILQLGQLPTEFEFKLTCDDVTHGKPDPEIYQLAADRFEVEPSEMLVLEDSATGCRAAMAAGAITIAVPGDHNRISDYPDVFMLADSLADPRLAAKLTRS